MFFVAVEIPLVPKIATIITGSSREISSTPSSELRKRSLEVVIGKNEALFADIIVKMWAKVPKHLFFVAVEILLMLKIATIITGSSREISSTPSSELRKRSLEVVIGKNEALFADIIVKMWAKVPKPALHSFYDFICKNLLQ